MEKELKEQFEKIDNKFDDVLQAVEVGFDDVHEKIDAVSQRLGVVEKEVKIVRGTMPTKEYIDDKLADLGAEISKRINRAYEEQRLFSIKLVEFLKTDRALKKDHVEQLEEMLA